MKNANTMYKGYRVVRDKTDGSVEIRKGFKLIYKSYAVVSGGNLPKMSDNEIIAKYVFGEN